MQVAAFLGGQEGAQFDFPLPVGQCQIGLDRSAPQVRAQPIAVGGPFPQPPARIVADDLRRAAGESTGPEGQIHHGHSRRQFISRQSVSGFHRFHDEPPSPPQKLIVVSHTSWQSEP